MYYLINNDSPLSFAQQIAIADTFIYEDSAIRTAKRRQEQTGQTWEVVKIACVYNTKEDA
jgi:hypothetical protein